MSQKRTPTQLIPSVLPRPRSPDCEVTLEVAAPEVCAASLVPPPGPTGRRSSIPRSPPRERGWRARVVSPARARGVAGARAQGCTGEVVIDRTEPTLGGFEQGFGAVEQRAKDRPALGATRA